MDSTTIDNNIIDYEAFYEEDGSVLISYLKRKVFSDFMI
jgi:hypothetical protein